MCLAMPGLSLSLGDLKGVVSPRWAGNRMQPQEEGAVGDLACWQWCWGGGKHVCLHWEVLGSLCACLGQGKPNRA